MVGKFTTQNGTTVTLTVTPAEGYYISNTYSTDVDFDFAEVTGLEAYKVRAIASIEDVLRVFDAFFTLFDANFTPFHRGKAVILQP